MKVESALQTKFPPFSIWRPADFGGNLEFEAEQLAQVMMAREAQLPGTIFGNTNIDYKKAEGKHDRQVTWLKNCMLNACCTDKKINYLICVT